MLHAGLSLQIFKKWAPDEKNMVSSWPDYFLALIIVMPAVSWASALLWFSQVVIPGYCVAGTVGHKVLSGQKKIELDKKSVVSNIKLRQL